MVTTSTYGAQRSLLDPFGSACAAVGPSHACGLQQHPSDPRVPGCEAAPDTVDALDQQVNDQPLGIPYGTPAVGCPRHPSVTAADSSNGEDSLQQHTSWRSSRDAGIAVA